MKYILYPCRTSWCFPRGSTTRPASDLYKLKGVSDPKLSRRKLVAFVMTTSTLETESRIRTLCVDAGGGSAEPLHHAR